jgi:hypothetical protein
MGILTTTDAPFFAPSLSNLSSEKLGALINYVNYLVESPQGANRPLAIKKWTEKLKLNIKLQNAYLSYRPLILDDPINYPITVQVRVANTLNYYGRGVPVQPWYDIEPSKFLLDIDGQIHCFFGQEYPFTYPNFNQNIRPTVTEMQVSYYSGLELISYNPQSEIKPSPDVMTLKSAAGEICNYLQSKLYSGVSSIQVPFDEFSINFNNQMEPFKIPDYLLYSFKNYKPYLKG